MRRRCWGSSVGMERGCWLRLGRWVVGAEGGVFAVRILQQQEGDLGRSCENVQKLRIRCVYDQLSFTA